MSNRLERLKGYSKPLRSENWQGESRQQYIDRWSGRATEESQIAPRASGSLATNGRPSRDLDPPDLQSTGKQMESRPTTTAPREARNVDKRMAAEKDLNFVGDSSYMAGVRRNS
jgi:hypothetical protein